MRKTIVCLANSYKHGGRCIAGVDVEDGAWIRLRGNASDGALCACEYALDDGTEPRLLDTIEVEVHYAVRSRSHPEDWQIAPSRWRLIERPATERQWAGLTNEKAGSKGILRDHRDRIAAWELKYKPMKSSLTLICPSEIYWWIREDKGKRKYRALFHHNYVTYDFALTDPHWLDRLKLLPDGIHPHANFAGAASETWLTISLSEPYFSFHYKLVAGVIVRNA
ncbi:MAG TPA: hypothetical protein VF865_11275 [Acidobacteriaceae bacterium]